MAAATRAQDRVADALAADPNVSRSSVVPRPNNLIEVWLYGHGGELREIATIEPSGHYTSRPGVRATTDTYIGYPEDRPDAEEIPF